MRPIDKIECRAAARAVQKTVRMLEETFGLKATGSTARKKRRSVIEQLEKIFHKLRRS